MRFFQINRDPNEEGVTGGESSPMEDALNTHLKDNETPEEKNDEGSELKPGDEGYVEPKKEDESKEEDQPKEIEAGEYKGPDRRKIKVETERRKDILEKINNIDLDFEYGHGDQKTKRVSLDEVKLALKYMQDNSEQIAAGISMNKYSQQFPEFGKLMNTIISGSFNDKNEYNGEFGTKIMKAIDAKEEQLEEKSDEIDTEIAKIEKILADGDIDPDSPQAEVLKSNLASMKAMKGRISTAMDKLEDATKQIEDVKKGQDTAQDTKAKEDHTAEVKRIGSLFDKEMRDLTDKEKKDGYKFVSDSEMAEHDAAVRAGVGKSVADAKIPQGQKMSDEQFIKLVRENAKAAYDAIVKKREAIVADYLKRKGLTPKKKEDEVIPESKEEMNIGDLTKTVEDLLPTE